MGIANLLLPEAGKPRGFMNVTMQSYQWLPLFDKPLDGNASNMNIEWHMINHFPIESGAVEVGLIWRAMKQYYRFRQIIFPEKPGEIIAYSTVFNILNRFCCPESFGRR